MRNFVCSQRAENVLKSAKDVVQSLDEASAAQIKAEEAIKQSTEDISLARADLDEVSLNLCFDPLRMSQKLIVCECVQ